MLTQSLLNTALGFVIASTISGLSYAGLVLTKHNPKFYRPSLWFFVLVLFASIWLLNVAVVHAVFLAMIVSVVPAICERKADENRFPVEHYYWPICIGVYQSVSVGLLLVTVGPHQLLGIFASKSPAFYYASALGAVFFGPAISIIRWMFHTSKLRPGVDRHLKEGEDPK